MNHSQLPRERMVDVVGKDAESKHVSLEARNLLHPTIIVANFLRTYVCPSAGRLGEHI